MKYLSSLIFKYIQVLPHPLPEAPPCVAPDLSSLDTGDPAVACLQFMDQAKRMSGAVSSGAGAEEEGETDCPVAEEKSDDEQTVRT